MPDFALARVTLTLALVVGCSSKINTRADTRSSASKLSEKQALEITGRTPVIVSPGDTVEITGHNFRPEMVVTLAEGQAIDALIDSDTKASFQVPADAPAGGANLTITQDDVTQKISLVFTAGKTDYPIVVGEPAILCAGTKYYDAIGVLREGTKVCNVAVEAKLCSNDGEVDCLTTATFKAAAVAALAAKVAVGASVAGVAGSYAPDFPAAANVLSTDTVNGSPGTMNPCSSAVSQGCYATGVYYASPMCGSDGAVSCVVDNGTSYKAAAAAALVAGNIKRGVVVGAITGNFPSATSPLPRYSDSGATTGTTGVDETDLTSFATQVTSVGTFEFWDGSGARRTGSGDADLVATNIKNNVALESLSLTGTYVGNVALPSASDLRVGVTVGAVTGVLKVNCRNTVNNTYYNYDGSIGSLPNTAIATGTVFDFWDTVDDYNGFTTNTPWSVPDSRFVCDGTNWTDVTPSSTCAATPASCQYQDNTSGLIVTKNISNSANWTTAMQDCASSTYGGASAGTWRLPTQKELMTLYINGVTSVAGPDFMTLASMQGSFWSSSTRSSAPSKAWYMYLSLGTTFFIEKTTSYQVACVR